MIRNFVFKKGFFLDFFNLFIFIYCYLYSRSIGDKLRKKELGIWKILFLCYFIIWENIGIWYLGFWGFKFFNNRIEIESLRYF